MSAPKNVVAGPPPKRILIPYGASTGEEKRPPKRDGSWSTAELSNVKKPSTKAPSARPAGGVIPPMAPVAVTRPVKENSTGSAWTAVAVKNVNRRHSAAHAVNRDGVLRVSRRRRVVRFSSKWLVAPNRRAGPTSGGNPVARNGGRRAKRASRKTHRSPIVSSQCAQSPPRRLDGQPRASSEILENLR